MNDSPTAIELLGAVARTLDVVAIPATSTSANRHALRIAANLCRIVGRELESAPEPDRDLALAELLGCDPGDDLARLIDERLQTEDPEFDAAVGDLLFADVCRRVDIGKPGYREPGK